MVGVRRPVYLQDRGVVPPTDRGTLERRVDLNAPLATQLRQAGVPGYTSQQSAQMLQQNLQRSPQIGQAEYGYDEAGRPTLIGDVQWPISPRATGQELLDQIARREAGLIDYWERTLPDVPELVTSIPGTGGTGGGMSDEEKARRALETLNAQLSGLDATYSPMLAEVAGRYGGLRSQLGQIAGQGRATISQAQGDALAALAQIDPQAAFDFAVQQVNVPSADVTYLERIGANPEAVRAAQALSQGLIERQLGASQAYAAGQQAALDRERVARQAAATLMGQEGMQSLAAQEQAILSAIAQRQAAEEASIQEQRRQREQDIRDTILEQQLKYGVTI